MHLTEELRRSIDVIRNTGRIKEALENLFSRGTLTGLGEDELLRRFAIEGDESAFAAIVKRHGPMVLGVCRRVLRDERDIEDAFQATFLVLVRRAGSIRDGRLIGRWLHGVAHRVAVRARAQVARRFVHERPITDEYESTSHSSPQIAQEAELLGILDEELGRLPGSLRSPMILCYLEGLTHDEAATRLGWPVGTVRSRMARARELLRRRLSRRGVMASGAVLPGSLAKMTVPLALIETTVRTSLTFLTKQSLAAAVATVTATGLANEVIRAMMITRLTVLGATALSCVLAFGGPSLARQFGGVGHKETQIEPSAEQIDVALVNSSSPTSKETNKGANEPAARINQADRDRNKEARVNAINAEILMKELDVLNAELQEINESLDNLRKDTIALENRLKDLRSSRETHEQEKTRLNNEIEKRKRELIALAAKGTVLPAEGVKSAPKSNPTQPVDRIATNTKTERNSHPSSVPQRILSVSNVVFVVSSAGDRVSASSLTGDKLKSVQLTEFGDAQIKVDLVVNGGDTDYTALHQTGGKCRRLAVFRKSDWTWRTLDLPEFTNRAVPYVTGDAVIFDLGSSVIVYNFKTDRWDPLKLTVPLEPGRLDPRFNPISFTHDGHLYRYDERTGKWSDLDTKALLTQPDRDLAYPPEKTPVRQVP